MPAFTEEREGEQDEDSNIQEQEARKQVIVKYETESY
jgi:hypothetical protein